MKKELSAIELHFIIEEMKELSGSKVDKIYQPQGDEILLQLHKTGIGKRIIRIKGKFMYLTEQKTESPQTPFGFCTYLRKKLSNAILKEIKQIGSERIAEIVFETKDEKNPRLRLIAELFGAGNIILVDNDYNILSPLTTQQFRDREVKRGERYIFPRKEYDLFGIDEKELSELIKKSAQDSIVKAFALDLGLGGVYSEELCSLSNIDKNKKPGTLSDQEIKTAFSKLKEITERKAEPFVVMDKNDAVDVVPFRLEAYKNLESIQKETYNSAIDSVVTARLVELEKNKKGKESNKEIERLRKSIGVQEKNIEKLRKDAEENHKKGEFIYENYAAVKEILDELAKARQKYSWKEIKEKLKCHKVVKEIDEKEGKVVVEI